MDSTITVRNAHIGDRVVPTTEVLNFPFGIPGFEQERRFVLIDDADFEPFQWLVSTENPDATFLVCSPYTIVPTIPSRWTMRSWINSKPSIPKT